MYFTPEDDGHPSVFAGTILFRTRRHFPRVLKLAHLDGAFGELSGDFEFSAQVSDEIPELAPRGERTANNEQRNRLQFPFHDSHGAFFCEDQSRALHWRGAGGRFHDLRTVYQTIALMT